MDSEYLYLSLIVLVLVSSILWELRKYIHSHTTKPNITTEPSYKKSDFVSYPFYVIRTNSIYYSDKLRKYYIKPDYKISSPAMLNDIFGSDGVQIIIEADAGICLYSGGDTCNTLNFRDDFTICTFNYEWRARVSVSNVVDLIMNYDIIQEQQRQKNLGIR